MLNFYGQRFSTVEINYTFRMVPKESVLENWAEQVPPNFRFVLKAPQKITHHRRLVNVAEELEHFVRTAAVLKKRLGPLLFQLPPDLKKDLPRLEAFLELLGEKTLAAIEFRHASWLDDEVFACLRSHAVALCIADIDEPVADLPSTADWGYVRLRREDYTDKELDTWVKNFKAQGWKQAYVFFRHEDTATGPKLAARFLERASD